MCSENNRHKTQHGGTKLTKEMREIICVTCDREFNAPETWFTEQGLDDDDIECHCCRQGHHVEWEGEIDRDNGCGDGWMMKGECEECGIKGETEVSRRDFTFCTFDEDGYATIEAETCN